jgi:type I restriction enzyme R subunit
LDNEAELAVFDLLQKESLTTKDRETIKTVAKELLVKLADQRFTLDRLRSMATVQAQMKAEIIKHLFANLPATAFNPDEINKKAGAVFSHLYSSGLGQGSLVHH